MIANRSFFSDFILRVRLLALFELFEVPKKAYHILSGHLELTDASNNSSLACKPYFHPNIVLLYL